MSVTTIAKLQMLFTIFQSFRSYWDHFSTRPFQFESGCWNISFTYHLLTYTCMRRTTVFLSSFELNCFFLWTWLLSCSMVCFLQAVLRLEMQDPDSLPLLLSAVEHLSTTFGFNHRSCLFKDTFILHFNCFLLKVKETSCK